MEVDFDTDYFLDTDRPDGYFEERDARMESISAAIVDGFKLIEEEKKKHSPSEDDDEPVIYSFDWYKENDAAYTQKVRDLGAHNKGEVWYIKKLISSKMRNDVAPVLNQEIINSTGEQ